MNKKVLKKLKDCCSRETTLRERVYPKLIATGKMTKEKADEEIKLMRLAALCFEKILQGTAPKDVQQTLFDIKEFDAPKRFYDLY